MFKRIFGKPDEEPSGLNVGRLSAAGSADAGTASPAGPDDFRMPSRKPAPNVRDLELPETLAEEAKHPREVDVHSVLAPRATQPSASSNAVPTELTDAQIDAIAKRVADTLASGIVGDRLRDAVTRIVSEASERLVRDEIARIRADADPPSRP